MLKDKLFLLLLVFSIMSFESCVTPKDKNSSSKPIVTKFVLDEEPSYQSKYENKFIQEQIWGFYDNEIRFSTGVIVPQETGGIKDYLFYKQNGINNCLAVMKNIEQNVWHGSQNIMAVYVQCYESLSIPVFSAI